MDLPSDEHVDQARNYFFRLILQNLAMATASVGFRLVGKLQRNDLKRCRFDPCFDLVGLQQSDAAVVQHSLDRGFYFAAADFAVAAADSVAADSAGSAVVFAGSVAADSFAADSVDSAAAGVVAFVAAVVAFVAVIYPYQELLVGRKLDR